MVSPTMRDREGVRGPNLQPFCRTTKRRNGEVSVSAVCLLVNHIGRVNYRPGRSETDTSSRALLAPSAFQGGVG